VEIRLKVVPGGSKDEVLGPYGDRLRVKVSAPPEGGRANGAVIALLARSLGVPAKDLTLTAGRATALKTVHVRGLSPDDVSTRL
jgi:hypothetical protein